MFFWKELDNIASKNGVIALHKRIRAARENMGYTREKFAEKLDGSVSYLAELERGRTGISVKMLLKVCGVLGLSADYVLFGTERDADALLLDKIRRIDGRYMPLLDKVLTELLALSGEISAEKRETGL